MTLVLTPLEIAAIQEVELQEQNRRFIMQRAWDAYMGIYAETDRTPPERKLVTAPGDKDDKVPVNLVGLTVDVGADYLFGNMPVFELPTDRDGEATDVVSEPEDWLDGCFQANHTAQLFLEAAINGSVFGTPYIAFDTNDPLPNADNRSKPFPRLYLKEPICMGMKWDQLNIGNITGYVWRSSLSNLMVPNVPLPVFGYQLILRNGRGTWDIVDAYSRLGNSEPIETGRTEWPYPWPPIVHWKNLPAPNQVYGRADVTEDLIIKNQALAYNLSFRQRIDRKHAMPKFVTVGVSHELRAEDDVWELEEDAKAELLAPATVSTSAVQTGADIYARFLEESGTPALVLGGGNENVRSGVQLLISMQPIVRKTMTKRKLVEPALKELCRRLWELGGFGPNMVPKVTWPELIPTDPYQQRQIMQLDLQYLGIKREVWANKLNYKPADLDPDFIPQGQAPIAGQDQRVPGTPDTNQLTPGAREKTQKEAQRAT